MKRVIYLAECHRCFLPLTVGIYLNLDRPETKTWLLEELPVLTRLYLQWRIEGMTHLCPTCMNGVVDDESTPWIVELHRP